MSKIAYIFHGHSRTWAQCYENFFKNVHSHLPGDIFIHTWDKVNASQASYWSPYGYQETLPSNLLEIANQTPDLKGIYEAYRPKVLLVEPDKKPDLSVLHGVESTRDSSTLSHVGTKNMLYQSKTIFNIARAYGKYDYYFSTRMDINYTEPITQEEITEMLGFGGLTTPWVKSAPGMLDVSDIWMFGPEEFMNTKTDYYFHIDELWFKRERNLATFGYEMGLYRYLVENCNVPIRPSSLSCKMVRLF